MPHKFFFSFWWCVKRAVFPVIWKECFVEGCFEKEEIWDIILSSICHLSYLFWLKFHGLSLLVFFDWGQMTGIGKEKTIWSFLVPVNMLYRYGYWQMVTVYFVNPDVRCQIHESRTGWLIKNLIHLTFHVGFFFFLQTWSLNFFFFFTNLESEYGFLERETKILWRCISVIANFRIKWWAGTLISSMFASRTMRWIWIYASLAESKNFSFVA